jgi:myo-inositol-1(or 4)-monophosphatase
VLGAPRPSGAEPGNLADCRETLVRAVRAAGTLQLNGQRDAVVSHKGIRDIVTDVDLACENAVITLVRMRHPEHGILAEEGTGERRSSEFLWILDPLDGTKNFAHGYPRFCVSLALAWREEVVLGAVYDPSADELFLAERGSGATCNGEPMRVSAVTDLSSALLAGALTTRNLPEAAQLRRVRAVLPHVHGLRSDGCAALDLCDVARGRFEGYFEEGLSVWDTAAGTLMVREAGGMTTDFSGNPHGLFGSETLATNGCVLPALVSLFRGSGEKP